jgi:hypothetical protein
MSFLFLNFEFFLSVRVQENWKNYHQTDQLLPANNIIIKKTISLLVRGRKNRRKHYFIQ